MASTRKNKALGKVASLVAKHKRFLIVAHQVPDGDALGSEMALHFALKAKKKSSTVLNGDPTPEKFRIVDPQNEIVRYHPGDKLPDFDIAFVMDTHDWKMLGILEKPLRDCGRPVVFVDHHAEEEGADERKGFPLLLVDETYGSTAELVYALILAMKVRCDLKMATALYTALLTDTGSFRFRRTSPQSHHMAAKLIQLGVSSEATYQAIYGNESPQKLRLLGAVLESLKTSVEGRLAWISIPLAWRRKYDASIEDTESFINQLTLLADVEIAILFREDEDGSIKLSFRGVREVAVLEIARSVGGGGHHYAAGARVHAKLEDLIPKVIRTAEVALAR